MTITRKLLLFGALALAACDSQPESGIAQAGSAPEAAGSVSGATCSIVEAEQALPDEVRETSGLAQSRRDPTLFWTHNDSGNAPDLFGIRLGGELVGRVRVQDAKAEDWEDLEAGPCESGSCLFVGDIGDNDADRESITIYEIPEPEPSAPESSPARVLRARFPDGARDAESLFVLPSGDLFIVTKGRQGAIALYRYPSPHRPNETVTLERIRELAPQPADEKDRVTGATSTPDGRWVAIRTYRTLFIYPAAALVGAGPVQPARVDLEPLGEIQGEALVLGDDGNVWLTSEAENKKDTARWGRLKCTLPTTG
jgi:hypothetical protein